MECKDEKKDKTGRDDEERSKNREREREGRRDGE